MNLKNLTIKVRGPRRAPQERGDTTGSPRPSLVHAPPVKPMAQAAPIPEEPEALEEAMAAPEPPSARDVADAVYKMFQDDVRKDQLRRGA